MNVMRVTLPVAALAAAAAVPLLSSCGTTTPPSSDGRLAVSAAFYPLAYLSEQIGGSHVDVSQLTKPGAEPHDLELTPKEVADLSHSDLVVYESGFQPAVDDAVTTLAGDTAFDVTPVARLDLAASADGSERTVTAPDSTGSTGGSLDPHFWLAPLKLAQVGEALASELGTVDPRHAADYTKNAAAFTRTMTRLDHEYRSGLSSCASRDLVTSHEAFGYLAQAYDLTQRGISGISPETEPPASQLAAISDFVQQHDVTTIYAETLVSSAVTQAIAHESGAAVAVLDPIEGITSSSKGTDYLEVMRSNLAALEKGQRCS